LRTVLQGDTYLSAEMAAVHKEAANKMGSDPLQRLSNRELQVLNLVGRGVSSRDIASELGLSVKTVESHRQSIKRKLHLLTNSQLIKYAMNLHAGRRQST
jgi:DNA-binding NarL/FixJ family response regulator